ncbi:hypothetical protein Vi05172_g1991 [Venturia inaequalis]|nr:hypothetical protein Vi05172_g1991 [Venturia inaequalis]
MAAFRTVKNRAVANKPGSLEKPQMHVAGERSDGRFRTASVLQGLNEYALFQATGTSTSAHQYDILEAQRSHRELSPSHTPSSHGSPSRTVLDYARRAAAALCQPNVAQQDNK